MLGSVARRTRSVVWRQCPFLARTEVRLRHRSLARRLWDLAFIEGLPRSAEAALDVGANIGVYTHGLARRFAVVHAFEPNPSVRGRLQALSSPTVQVWPVGLSDTPQHVDLVVPVARTGEVSGLGSLEPGVHDGEGVVRHPAQVVRLDDLGFERVGLIKVDVEGHESAVLRGGSRLLESAKAIVVVESEDRHRPGAPIEVRQQLAELGYRGFFAFRGEVLEAEAFSVAAHQAPSLELSASGYAHMFVYTNSDPTPVVAALKSVAPLSR